MDEYAPAVCAAPGPPRTRHQKATQPMLFPTLNFGLFFLVVFAASWAMIGRPEARKGLLLAASFFFYGYWDWRFLSLLAASAAINYLAGIAITRETVDGRRKLAVGLAVAANLIILGFFKYYDFFTESLSDVLGTVGLERDMLLLDVILPIGISFFTFQGISYVVDVYRRNIPAVDGPLDLFLYISFFPQLVAGPIVRAADFLPQLKKTPTLDMATVTFGFVLIVVGLLKKMIVASYLATEIVDDVFSFPAGSSSLDLLVGCYAFVVQIYCDFSGYSDIAIGASQVLGYDLMLNFRQPYHAATVQGFWRRWHISLSTWFRDYLYIPLGGNRVSTARRYANLFVVFVVSGLWHGAAWTFVAWGALHGFYLVFGMWTREARKRFADAIGLTRAPLLYKGLQIATTFLLVTWAWIFFRADSIADAWYVGTHLFAASPPGADVYLSMGSYDFWVGVAAIAILEAVHLGQRGVRLRPWLAERPTAVRWGLYYAAVMLLLLFANTDGGKFIYFQF